MISRDLGAHLGETLSRQVGKTNVKSKVVTGNEPSVDKPTTTTVDNLGRKQEKSGKRRDANYCKRVSVLLLLRNLR